MAYDSSLRQRFCATSPDASLYASLKVSLTTRTGSSEQQRECFGI